MNALDPIVQFQSVDPLGLKYEEVVKAWTSSWGSGERF
jgi:hypothetical protein